MIEIPLEKSITKSITSFLRSHKDAFVFKIAGTSWQRHGMPDIMYIHDGNHIFFEVKRPHVGRVTPVQRATIDRLRKAGAFVFIVTSVQEVKMIVDQTEKLCKARREAERQSNEILEKEKRDG